ncbi:isocitrate lyase/PEP mutase family protein [Streptomyces wuyuanensis]|uniref:2-Methylisocitrate lyase, PEP mutase family n=1 Tax=Streptomyces wuyuanensis TaxID=1196353 RepID=A0A1G9NP47_9ACTN|nr:isocitrate lyase/phosphoenolpyruvate mutase family protein [Streptomyces wuyuanensis]SDL88134.1 2-Methylisocitrate lyase, PEP mutase family [Streptomyces wuyuanensis]
MSAADFRDLHHGRAPEDPLVLPGPWDAVSARVFADAGFPALATPSAAVAASLGYEDGGTPADEMFAAVARIVRSVDVPVSADVEAGYGLPAGELVARVLETGAVGINLEDSDPGEALVEPLRQADRLAEIRAEAGDALFVNARVDTFLLGVSDPGAAAIERARLYVAAGADCVYPIGAPMDALPRLRREITGPINAVASPGAPGAPALGRLGVTRVTFGPGLLLHTLDALREWSTRLRG